MSTSNPYKIYEFWKSGTDYLRFNPFENQIRDIRWWPFSDKKVLKVFEYLDEEIPTQILELFASIPFIGTKQMRD